MEKTESTAHDDLPVPSPAADQSTLAESERKELLFHKGWHRLGITRFVRPRSGAKTRLIRPNGRGSAGVFL